MPSYWEESEEVHKVTDTSVRPNPLLSLKLAEPRFTGYVIHIYQVQFI
jgi:hypothetical protein